MNGKRAKKLRRMALEYVVGVMKKGAEEGYNQYNQAMNRIEMQPSLDENGHPILVGGQAVLKPTKAPGTITSAWHLRTMYKHLKKRWKRRV